MNHIECHAEEEEFWCQSTKNFIPQLLLNNLAVAASLKVSIAPLFFNLETNNCLLTILDYQISW